MSRTIWYTKNGKMDHIAMQDMSQKLLGVLKFRGFARSAGF
ncbi:hypothetical protein J2S92_004255 [Arthrobacter bambusae]|nr:hypothetical protein [Arthrobacter bambusae]MDQ0237873.1 hypothetical protein [Arthrobacter bambusae]